MVIYLSRLHVYLPYIYLLVLPSNLILCGFPSLYARNRWIYIPPLYSHSKYVIWNINNILTACKCIITYIIWPFNLPDLQVDWLWPSHTAQSDISLWSQIPPSGLFLYHCRKPPPDSMIPVKSICWKKNKEINSHWFNIFKKQYLFSKKRFQSIVHSNAKKKNQNFT